VLTSPPVDPVETFRDSLKRCLAAPDFLLDFYGLFMASSDEVREKFANTDFERQTRILADSLWAMAVAHSREQLDIRPEFYDQWLDCLVEAASRHDPSFSAGVERAWRETLAVGIALMKSRY